MAIEQSREKGQHVGWRHKTCVSRYFWGFPIMSESSKSITPFLLLEDSGEGAHPSNRLRVPTGSVLHGKSRCHGIAT